MICPLFRIAQSNPTDIFLIEGKYQWSYQQCDQQTQGIVEWLTNNNYTNGTKIAIHNRSIFSSFCWVLASARVGAVIAIVSERETATAISSMVSNYNLTFIDSNHPDPSPHQSKKSTISENSPFTMLFTSGSSGQPKAVIHSFENHWNSAKASKKNIAFTHGDRWLLSLSIWHIGGLAILFRTLAGKATAVVKQTNISMSKQITQDHITHISVVSVQLQMLLNGDCSLPSLKHILVGGGPIPSSLIQNAIDCALPIHCTYGMTELSSQLATTPPKATFDVLQSAGKSIGDWKILINSDGEICVKGSSLFLGYWDGKEIINPLDNDGFFHTNDLGKINAGHLYVLGRKDQMFISGGENIHPEEIEKVLCSIVEAAIVVSIPCIQYGRRPVAFLRGKWRLEDIQTLLNKRLPSFKHPDHFLPWPEHISPHKASRLLLQQLACSIVLK